MVELRRTLAHCVGPQVPTSAAAFLAGYRGDRRFKVYSDAVKSLETVPVGQQDALLTTFVKCEKINFSAKEDPAPRVIQPRTPRYNVEVGCFLRHLEKKVYRALGELFGGPTVMKGYNAHESARELRAMWESFDDPVAIGLDASRFDQHCGVEALQWEHSVYEACFVGSDKKRLRELLSWQLKNRGIARTSDGVVRYEVDGCRMSGDMNTALGNCLIMCALVYKLVRGLNIRVRLANNGDDCVVFMERKHTELFNQAVAPFFLDHGYTMKVEDAVDVFEEIEFCQTHPIWVGPNPEDWLMCRNALVAMAKDSVSVLPLTQGKLAQAWCTAIGECGMSLSGGVPIFQEFYTALLRAGGGQRMGHHPALESGFARLASGMHRRYCEVSDETRVSFWKAFRILPSEQMVLEDALRAHTPDVSQVHRRESVTPDLSFLPGVLQ